MLVGNTSCKITQVQDSYLQVLAPDTPSITNKGGDAEIIVRLYNFFPHVFSRGRVTITKQGIVVVQVRLGFFRRSAGVVHYASMEQEPIDSDLLWPVILGVLMTIAFISCIVIGAIYLKRRRRTREKARAVRVQTEVVRVDRAQNEYECVIIFL